MKKIITNKYFWVGSLMGISQQFMGRLDYYLYHGRNIFSFSAIMGSLSLYAGIILFIISKEKGHKLQACDTFLYFLGLDFFYYFYIFIKDLVEYISIKLCHPEKIYESGYFFQSTHAEIFDFIKWTIIATAASLWVFFSVKFRERNCKKRYFAMLIPLFLVIIFEMASYSDSMYHYIVQEYRIKHNLSVPENSFYVCTISELLTSVVALIICIRKYYSKRNKKN